MNQNNITRLFLILLSIYWLIGESEYGYLSTLYRLSVSCVDRPSQIDHPHQTSKNDPNRLLIQTIIGSNLICFIIYNISKFGVDQTNSY